MDAGGEPRPFPSEGDPVDPEWRIYARSAGDDKAPIASLGIRLVKGNEPGQMKNLVVSHIEKMGFHVVSEVPDMSLRLKYPRIAKVTGGGGSTASRTSMTNPFGQSVVAAARIAAE